MKVKKGGTYYYAPSIFYMSHYYISFVLSQTLLFLTIHFKKKFQKI